VQQQQEVPHQKAKATAHNHCTAESQESSPPASHNVCAPQLAASAQAWHLALLLPPPPTSKDNSWPPSCASSCHLPTHCPPPPTHTQTGLSATLFDLPQLQDLSALGKITSLPGDLVLWLLPK
jgi:hypothetical protein